jgi:hypothetical protein
MNQQKINIELFGFKLSRPIELLAFLVLLVLMFFSMVNSLSVNQYQHFSLQAEFILEGHLDIDVSIFETLDTTYSEHTGKHYWPLGIFSTIVLVPLVALFNLLGSTQLVLQAYLSIPFTIIILILCYKLARQHKFPQVDSLFLAIAFCFGSIYCLAAYVPRSWYFAHGLAVLLLIVAIYEYTTRRRFWLIGILMGLLMHTRYISALCAAYFALEILFSKQDSKRKLVQMSQLIIPMVVSGLILLYLNYIRFGNIFDTGYTYADVGQGFLLAARDEYGYFNLASIPRNFYYYFIAFLDPIVDPLTQHFIAPFFKLNPAGLGFFFISPIFAVSFINFKLKRETIFFWIVSLGVLFILLTHYTTGYVTYGPRYMMDFLPLWYMILLKSFMQQKLRPVHYFIIIASALLNVIFIADIFAY